MAVMSMRRVVSAVNDKTQVRIYKGKSLVTKGNWYQDSILHYIKEPLVEADLDAVSNVCKVHLMDYKEADLC